ncbi:MAG: cell wall hydrolase [Clostridia bacterium]|nr:cell wall hydrolase [Clostridia bacterium]
MTKKLAGLTGTFSVFSASIILILAFLISPIRLQFPAASFSTHSNEEKGGESGFSVTEMPETEPLSEVFSGEADYAEIFGITQKSPAVSMLGVDAVLRSEKLNSIDFSVMAAKAEADFFEVTVSVSSEEREMIMYCVDHEAGGGSVEHRVLVTQVILNRAQGVKFPSNVKDVLTAGSQFDGMIGYDEREGWNASDLTARAVDYVLSGQSPDHSNGALYFCNPTIVGENNWFDNCLQAVCEIEGHRFYK